MGPCAFCRQTVDVPATCPRCRTLYHADCWVANDHRCAIYGCEPAPAADPPLPRYMVVLPPPASTWSAGWIIAICVVVISAAGWWIGPTPRPLPQAPRHAEPGRPSVDRLIADADWIAASMLQAPVPTDAEMRGAWRRNVSAAVDRLRKAQTLLSPGEVHSRIDPRLAELSDLRMRLDD